MNSSKETLMDSALELVWDNPRPHALERNDPKMLRLLGDLLAGAIRCGYLEGARRVASIHHLSPLASTLVARRMVQSGISEDDVFRVV